MIALGTASHAQEIKLRWKFTPAESESYRLIQNAEIDLTLQSGRNLTTSVSREFEFVWKIADVAEDDSASIAVQVTDVRLHVVGPHGEETTFDSQGEEEPTGFAATLSPLFRTLMESEIKARLTSLGEVGDMEIPEDLQIVLASKPVGKALGTLGTERDMESLIDLATLEFPEEALPIDGQWSIEASHDLVSPGSENMGKNFVSEEVLDVEDSQQENAVGTLLGIYICRIESLEEKDGDQIATITIDPKTSYFQEEPDNRETEIVGQEGAGKILFNVTTGRLLSQELSQKLQLETSGGGQPATGVLRHELKVQRLNEALAD